MKFRNANEMMHFFIKQYLKRGMKVVDCTVGNGKDTLFLKDLMGETGKIYGIDIQNLAIENTKKRLLEHSNMDNVELIHQGHELLDRYIFEPIDLFIYNLGYLPNSDKEIKTTYVTTIQSIEKAMALLVEGGYIMLVMYTGHKEGEKERNNIMDYLKDIDQTFYDISHHCYINQVNNPPELVMIYKKES